MERVKLRPSVRATLEHTLPIADQDVEVNGWICEQATLAGSPYSWWAIALNYVGRTAHRQGFKTRAECVAYAEATKHPFPPKHLES